MALGCVRRSRPHSVEGC
uniref:Uncharacterized protein n=1 Tax=Anguilla anguilla TaxID=7936 RepID=A0A0E9VKI1_ANGAN